MTEYKVNEALVKDDIYQAVNGEWLENAEIPADKPTTGGFSTVAQDVEKVMMEDVEKIANGEIVIEDPVADEFIKLYKEANDFERLDEEGAKPAKPYLDRIKELKAWDAFEEYFVEASYKSLPLPASISVGTNMTNTYEHIIYLGAPSTILPDVTYYDEENPAYASGQALLEVYKNSAVNLLNLLEVEDASKYVEGAVRFDAKIVPHVMSQEEKSDMTKMHNPRSLEEVEAYSSKISFTKLIKELTGVEPSEVNVIDSRYFEALDGILVDDNFEDLKSYLLVRTAFSISSYLSEEIRQAGSQYSLALSGNPETVSRQKHAYQLSTGAFGDLLGIYYGKTYFGEDAKADVEDMVNNMIDVYRERLKSNDWLSPATIEQAIVKLDAIEVLIGYPEEYPEHYKLYKVDSQKSLLDNVIAITEVDTKDNYQELTKPVDRNKWLMSAHTVNAYFSPFMNHICFPAAILQKPFYDYNQSRSANYGGIGAVIAHEISHAFDTNGAKFDEVGNLANWWTDEDFKAFEERSQAMIDQWEGVPYGSGAVNGALTVSENIADAGGLTAACEALKREEEYDLKEFFYNWVRVWATKSRPEYVDLLLQVDVHAPSELRAKVVPTNLDDFHEVFGTKEGDGMYRAKEDRVVIW